VKPTRLGFYPSGVTPLIWIRRRIRGHPGCLCHSDQPGTEILAATSTGLSRRNPRHTFPRYTHLFPSSTTYIFRRSYLYSFKESK